jgi:hypothetical protein
VSSLTAEDESEAGWDLPSRQPSQLSELMINSDETNIQAEQCEVTRGQEQFREGEDFGLNNTEKDACIELEILPSQVYDLLKLMWKTMQEERVKREKFRREVRERQERNRKEDRERLEQIIEKFRKDVEKCEERASKLAVDFSDLENKTEHSIAEVKRNIQGVEQVQSQQMSEARVSHAAVETELAEHKRGVENRLTAFRDELSKFKEDITTECHSEIGEKLDAVSRESSTGLSKIVDKLHALEEWAAAAAGTGALPSTANQIDDTGGRIQTGLSPTDRGTEGFRHSFGGRGSQCDREIIETVISQNNTYNDCNNHVNVKVAGQGTLQLMHDVSKDICLLKFADHRNQNVVQFLADLESYFHLRSVPEPFKLILAKSAVHDSYTSQWINTVYKELNSYEQFKKAITEFVWGPQAQARWRCALYQGTYDRNADRSMTAHFLRYSAVASNLTPKLNEWEIVEVISCHYPAYVQRTILSAGVRTIRDALNLLKRLESMFALVCPNV